MIYITGASGFLGQSLFKRLYPLYGTKCIILPRSLDNPEDIEPQPRSVIVNCAWAGVLGSQRDSLVQSQNIGYTRKLARFALNNQISHVISFGSQAEYGNINFASDESLSVNPLTLYGKTKVYCHNLLLDLLSQKGIPLTWLRLYDPYGPGDNPKWFLPYLIKSALDDISPSLTACTQIWDYIFIEDVLDLILLIIKARPKSSSVYNVSSSIPVLLKDVVETVFSTVKPPNAKPMYGAVPFRDGQQFYVSGSNIKACSDFCWSPSVSLNQGLDLTIESIKALTYLK